MTHVLQNLQERNLITPPPWLCQNTMLLVTMGSIAYGVAEDTSDFDVYGFCIPPKDQIFPYQSKLYGFDEVSVFQQYQQHHVLDKDALGGKGREYDFSIFNIVKYFKLCMECNPNMIDSMFVPQNCILHSTKVSEMIRDRRKLFLSKMMWPKFKGYAFSTLSKMNVKNHERIDPVVRFERKHNISQTTTFEEVEKEMKKRKLLS